MKKGRWMQWECLSPHDLAQASHRTTVVSAYEDPDWVTFSKKVPPDGKVTVKFDGSDPDTQPGKVKMAVLHGWRLPQMTPGRAVVRLDDILSVKPIEWSGGERCFALVELSCPLFPGPSNRSGSILVPASACWCHEQLGFGHEVRIEHLSFLR